MMLAVVSWPACSMMKPVIAAVATFISSLATAAMTGFIMLQAGHETTASMIALGTMLLLDHPDVITQLRENDDPAVSLKIVR